MVIPKVYNLRRTVHVIDYIARDYFTDYIGAKRGLKHIAPSIAQAESERTLKIKAQQEEQTSSKTLTLAERLGPQTNSDLLNRITEATATPQDPADLFRQNKTKLFR
ncbi:hypothetical protein PTTG_25596 [Puccinia triticina 1-1 BBBD Race 1]|uniref:Uncharacterized protein n=1 Tax=Puccinia triticina (isolate 1-1 / race 1 (BBBD)) TaxID=630390 RepID=A0A180H0L7_PUCT1|nr:hypothetical protein PTTG_25596 [Puccinia triticina 1-1 BBBD Race 1]